MKKTLLILGIALTSLTINAQVTVRHVAVKSAGGFNIDFYNINDDYIKVKTEAIDDNKGYIVKLPNYNSNKYSFKTSMNIVHLGNQKTYVKTDNSSGVSEFKKESDVISFFKKNGYKLNKSIPNSYGSVFIFTK
tara:strand:- start:1039 stop:1440 length:402 start_codon:yes stop_codon:yes gene_type:complete